MRIDATNIRIKFQTCVIPSSKSHYFHHFLYEFKAIYRIIISLAKQIIRLIRSIRSFFSFITFRVDSCHSYSP